MASARATRGVAALAALALVTGCGPGDPDLALELSFDGVRSCSTAGVDEVFVHFDDGPADVRRPCDVSGLTLVYERVPARPYRVLLQASKGGNVVYSLKEDLLHTAEGTHRYAVNLQPVTPELVALLTFAGRGTEPGLTCAEAEVATVTYTATRRAPQSGTLTWTDRPCRTGTRDGASLLDLQPGTVDLQVQASDAAGVRLYDSVFEALAVGPGANVFELNVLPARGLTGALRLSWTFEDLGCDAAAVTSVRYEVRDGAGATAAAATVPCGSAPVLLEGLAPGVYALQELSGIKGAVAAYRAGGVRLFAPAGKTHDFDIRVPRL